jgi:hypothetical protein
MALKRQHAIAATVHFVTREAKRAPHSKNVCTTDITHSVNVPNEGPSSSPACGTCE